MKNNPKTIAIKVIQQNYGSGWEDNSEYWPVNGSIDLKLIKHDLSEYRLTGYPTRVINRRVKNELKEV